MARATKSPRPTMEPAADATLRRMAVGLYAALGFVTLSHEVAWTRQLIGMVGSAMGAVGIMLAVFMGGLALGSWLGGRAAERSGSLARLLATLLVLAGATSLLSIPVDRIASVVQVAKWFPSFGPASNVVVSLLITVPVMMLPALFVGAAFPAVSALASKDGNLMSGIGNALTAQTAGSVVGALASGFVLLPTLGVDGTFVLGSVVAIVGGFALRGVRPDAHRVASAASREPSEVTPLISASRLALVLSGAATLVYEVAWTRELLLLFGSGVYATAVMLASVLLGLGLGQWWGSRQKASVPGGLARVSQIMFAAAIAGTLSVVMTRVAPVIYTYAFMSLRGSLFLVGIVELLLASLVVIVPATLVGMASPLMIRFAVASSEDRERKAGIAYAFNTLGSVIGSVAAGFLLVPLLTAKGAVAIAALLQIGVAATYRITASRAFGARRPVSAIALAVLVAAAAAYVSVDAASPLLNLTLRRPTQATAAAVLASDKQAEPVYFKDAEQGRVAVYRLPNDQYVLRGSGMVEGALGLVDAQTTELLVRLPAAEVDARHYFVIGLGTGSTTYTALQVPGVESVDTVELNPAVIPASRYFVDSLLDNDPRSRIHIDDARVYLGSVETTYDVIVSEPSYPLSPFSAQLFTREFFELERTRLGEGGVAVQWLPAYLLETEDAQMMIKTFASVFPQTQVWSTFVGDNMTVDLILVGVNGEAEVDPEAVAQEIRASGGESFNFTYELSPNEVKAITENATIPVNTDDRPLLEYRTPLRQIAALWK